VSLVDLVSDNTTQVFYFVFVWQSEPMFLAVYSGESGVVGLYIYIYIYICRCVCAVSCEYLLIFFINSVIN
jgi:hypothetical protein